MSQKTCIVCGHSDRKVVFKEFDIDIVKCTRCGHIYSTHELDQNYDGYWGDAIPEGNESFWFDVAHRDMYDDFCKQFIKGRKGRLLDIGCGQGFFIKHLAPYSSWEVSGCEISPSATKFAKESLGLERIFCGKVEDSDFSKNHFDIITLWDVIEHIPDPDPMLSFLSTLLHDDGFLFLHTPNIQVHLPKAKLKKLLKGMKSGVHYLEAKDHMNIYSVRSINSILNRNGFKEIQYTHLKPIQSVAGSNHPLLKGLKNTWYYGALGLYWLSMRHINLDNLFVLAKK